MSLHRWLRKRDGQSSSYLPDADSGSVVEAAKKSVPEELDKPDNKRKRKRGDYHHYSREVRAKVAKYACHYGNKSAVKKFSKELGHDLSEATVRNFKRKYLDKVKNVDPESITSLPSAPSGRPLLLGKYDDEVAEYVRKLQLSGGILNSSILIAAANGIIAHKNPGLLKGYGGSLELGKKWAESFLIRNGYVKRKATKAARKLPHDSSDLKQNYLRRIQQVTSYHIPLELLFNWDETGVKLIPVSSWTMAESGLKQISVVGLEDKREVTAVLAATATGTLLPPQVIYQGKTSGCHAKVTFPEKWHITHSDTHWSTERTMLEYIESINSICY